MAERALPEPQDDQDRQILGWVEEYGWAVLGIETDEEGPGYTYSVGLWRGWQHPEIVIFGLGHEVAQHLINRLGVSIKEGERFEPNCEYEEIIKGYSVVFVEVDPTQVGPYFGYGCWFNRGADFPVLQCVWPDRAGVFPWEEGFEEAFVERQPVLCVPDPS